MTEREVFEAALELPLENRAAFLDGVCGGDAALRQRLEALLSQHDRAGSFLEKPAITGAFRPDAGFQADSVGQVLAGRYTLTEAIGEGGMGTVWLAQQSEPVKRLVAIKLIKAGMDSQQVLARFEAERQALALMDHPNIAKVHDAGTTPDGRPFFVMELVKGVPITQYCDERRLTPRQRLELFVPVCQAIQHAHHKGIIHRDIKPSNVLVALYDDQPVVKVIDFGVAKATGQQLTEQTLETGFGSVVGTLEYMSPEQASFNQLDIDTRSDIYSLGVVLYELLAGSPPFSCKELQQGGMLEMLRLIREQEPSRPSTKLSTAEELPSIAACRGVEPGHLSGLVRGELDWIVMKCLEKDRDRRYETANALALDIHRYLADEPVLACPPSRWYRVRKFVRRNRGPVLAAAAVLLTLVGGIVGTTWGLVRSEIARAGEEQQRLAAEAERTRAVRAERDTRMTFAFAEALNSFLLHDLLGQADIGKQPLMIGGQSGPRNPNITVRELVDRAAKKLEGSFTRRDLGDPQLRVAVKAGIGVTVGGIYRSLGDYPQAQKHLERAVVLCRDALGPNHRNTLGAKRQLVLLLFDQGRYDRAEAVLREVFDACREKGEADDPETLRDKYNLAAVYLFQGKHALAETLLTELLLDTAKLGVNDVLTLACKTTLANVYSRLGKYDRAEVLCREALEGYTASLGDDHPLTLQGKGNLAWMYRKQKNYGRAEALYQEAIADQTKHLPPDHPSTLTSKHDLADMYQELKKYDQAESLLKEVFAARLTKLGPAHPHTLVSKLNLGTLYSNTARHKEAVPLFEELLRIRRKIPGEAPPRPGSVAFNLAASYQRLGRLRDAMVLIEEWLPRVRARFGLGHSDTQEGVEVALSLYGNAATPALAEAFYKELLQAQTDELGADHLYTLLTKCYLGAMYWRMRRYTESVPLFEQELRGRRKLAGDDDTKTLLAAFNLAMNYCDSGEVVKAVGVIEEWLPRARAKRDLADNTMNLGVAVAVHTYDRAGLHAKAEPLLRDLAAFWMRHADANSAPYATQLGLLGKNLLRQKKAAEAEPLLRKCLAIHQKQGGELWTTFETQSLLGEALQSQKKYADAEPHLLRGYEGLKQCEAKIPKDQSAVLTQALERLIQLYSAWQNKGDRAAEWQQRLDAHNETIKKAMKPKDK